MKVNVTTDEVGRCLRVLQAAKCSIVAADLADKLGLVGSRESKRRHVRAIVKKLRDSGSMVVATKQNGYALTDDETIWAEYNEGRKIDAKRIFAKVYERQKERPVDDGQGLLFTLYGPGLGRG